MVTILINGAERELLKLKARLWRQVMKFDEERKEILAVDAVDRYCEIIALAFGVTADEVLDGLYIEEVLPKYFEVLNEVVGMLTAKLGKKNAEEETAPAGEMALAI